MYSSIILLIRFTIAGLLGVILNFLTTYILKEFLKINKFISNSIGISLALFVNFLLNRNWTFNKNHEIISTQIYIYLIIVLISIFFNHAIVYLCNKRLNINFYFSKCIAVFLIFFWNYYMHSNYTFI